MKLRYAIPRPRCGARRGFSLFELMIVVAVIVVLSAIAIPYAQGFISSQRLQEVAWQVVEDLKTTREAAILYQQDLNAYFNYNNTPVEPTSATNTNNKVYWFETFQWGKDQTTQVDNSHYLPTDTPCSHLTYRMLKYNVIIDSVTATAASIQIPSGGKKYFTLCFRSGAGSSFRGEGDWVTVMTTRANTTSAMIDTSGVTIKLRDPSSNKAYYVIVEGTGKVSMNGSPPS